MAEEKEFVFEDAFISAALSLLNCKVIPRFNPTTNRVEFRIEGDVREALKRIYQNESLGVMDMGQAVKRLRNSIFILRSMQETRKGG